MKNYPELPKRKKRKAVQFYLHAAGMRNHPPLKRMKIGLLFAYYLLEVISEALDLTLLMDSAAVADMAVELGFQESVIRVWLQECITRGVAEGYMFKEKFYLRSSYLEEKLLAGAGKHKDRDAVVENDKSKGFYIAQPKDLKMVEAYFRERGFPSPEHNAEKFYNFHEMNGWTYGNIPKPIIKWKARANQWNMDDIDGGIPGVNHGEATSGNWVEQTTTKSAFG